MESRRTMRRAEEPEWSPKGRAKLRLPFQSFCLSGALLLAPPPPRARLRLPVLTCLSLCLSLCRQANLVLKNVSTARNLQLGFQLFVTKAVFFFLLIGFVASLVRRKRG